MRIDAAATGRGYLVSDLGLLEIMGVTSGFQAVLVIALYIHSPETRVMYRHPDLLWFLCPLLLHWVGRLWLYATRGYLDEDPIVYAITDRVSLIGAVLALIGCLDQLPQLVKHRYVRRRSLAWNAPFNAVHLGRHSSNSLVHVHAARPGSCRASSA